MVLDIRVNVWDWSVGIDYKVAPKEYLEVMEIFYMLIRLVVEWLCIFIKAHWIVHLKYVYFII